MGLAPKTVQFDFDGVIHAAPRGYQDGSVYGELDFTGVRAVMERGYSVVVASAGGVRRAATALEDSGFAVLEDPFLEVKLWEGGRTGKVILVQPKCAAVMYVDDRALNQQYGENWNRVLSGLRSVENDGRGAFTAFGREPMEEEVGA